MNKVRLLSILVGGLLILNLAVLWVFTRGDRPGGPHHRPREIIIDRLKFDQAQVDEYDGLIKIHRSSIDEAQYQIMGIKKELYQKLDDASVDTIQVQQLTDSIAAVQDRIEKIHFYHFRDIRALCKGEQIARFDAFSEELAELFAPPHKGPRP